MKHERCWRNIGNNSLNLLLLKLLWGVCTSAMGIHSAIVSEKVISALE